MSSAQKVSDLLPCPFCGGEGTYQTDTEEDTFSEEWIGCTDCGATAAIEVWKRRAAPTPDALAPVRAKVVSALYGEGVDPGHSLGDMIDSLILLSRASFNAPTPDAQSEVVEKALEWAGGPTGHYTEYAESPVGQWAVWEIQGNAYYRAPDAKAGKRVGATAEEAKAAAQADFAQRVQSCLTVGVVRVERVEWNAGIETAPVASTLLATYFDEDVGEWIVEIFVADAPRAPFTHWQYVTSPKGPWVSEADSAAPVAITNEMVTALRKIADFPAVSSHDDAWKATRMAAIAQAALASKPEGER